MTRLIKGNELQPNTMKEVLASYVYRLTRENILRRPHLFRGWMNGNAPYNLQWTTDDRWLAQHAFYVNKDGQLSRKHRHCEPAFMVEV